METNNQQVAVITGAGSGLGAALARGLSKHGYHICLLGRSYDKLQKTLDSLVGTSTIYVVDVTKISSVQVCFQGIRKDHHVIDILINNAGMAMFGELDSLPIMDVDGMIDTNLKGSIYCTMESIGIMKAINSGIILNIISTAGLVGKKNESVYCASKFGLRGFTESLRMELRETNIKVMAAYMGAMDTPFWEKVKYEKAKMDTSQVAEIITYHLVNHKNIVVKDIVIDKCT